MSFFFVCWVIHVSCVARSISGNSENHAQMFTERYVYMREKVSKTNSFVTSLAEVELLARATRVLANRYRL